MNAATGFRLDPGIARMTSPVAALGISDLLLMEDSRFPGLLLVPRRAGATELIDLDAAERGAIFPGGLESSPKLGERGLLLALVSCSEAGCVDCLGQRQRAGQTIKRRGRDPRGPDLQADLHGAHQREAAYQKGINSDAEPLAQPPWTG